MADKLQAQIAKAKEKQKAAKAQLRKLESKRREQVKKYHERVQFLWGQVVAQALQDEAISITQWQELCERYLEREAERQDALEALNELDAIANRKRAKKLGKMKPGEDKKTTVETLENVPAEAPKTPVPEPETTKKGLFGRKRS